MPLARYLPGAQPTHPAPAVPAGHRWHTALPAWDSVPAAHGAQDVALVAVHAFDCHGAHAAGLTTGWAGRLERHYAEIFTPADVIGDGLVDVARALAALPAG